jgi:preprotein translocase subunit SecD
MNNMMTLLFSLVFVLTSCADNSLTERKQNSGDRLLEDPEHHIKDSPDILKHDSTILYTGWYYVVDSSNSYKRQLDKSEEAYYLDPKPIVTAKNFTKFEIYESNFKDKKYLGLTMRLDKEGTESWSNATLRAQGSRLAFILDNRLLQVAMVNSQITGGVTALNRGDYSRQELENFKTIIESEK